MILLKRYLLILTIVCARALLLPQAAYCAQASPERDTALRILDERTSFRWGEDNLAWVVHYPEALIDPWVASESARKKYNPEQTANFRKAFMNELKSDAATAIMLSVHSFGANPVKLSPVAKNVALIDASGKRVAPMVFEKKLENPTSGLLQGFVFFPKQSADDFRIAVNGLVPGRETVFSFGGSGGGAAAIVSSPSISSAPKKQRADIEPPREEVVVKIPEVKPPTPPAPPKTSEDAKKNEPVFSPDAEIFKPTRPVIETAETFPREALPQTKPSAPRLLPSQVLDVFLKAWMAGDADKMYGMLTTRSQANISKELFEKDTLSAGGFRQGLREGYKVSWDGLSAKVTVPQKLLLVRTLTSRRITFEEEDGSYRIAW